MMVSCCFVSEMEISYIKIYDLKNVYIEVAAKNPRGLTLFANENIILLWQI